MDSTSASYEKERIPEWLKWSVWKRDDFTCHYCEGRAFLSLDHVIPESQGGETTEANLVTACSRCNSRKGTGDYWSFMVQQMAAGCGWGIVERAYRNLTRRHVQTERDLERLRLYVELRHQFPDTAGPLEALKKRGLDAGPLRDDSLCCSMCGNEVGKRVRAIQNRGVQICEACVREGVRLFGEEPSS